ncbi:hypothetical protein JRO89_XS01G0105000 [Xanthoceras sorbifolium]|uniref:NB-ARC domain-containing protein n=1 Tax=Xanthoceras sorbifolium TaxID=99658 RepID=A0ABQ8IIQ7_9ROSI|nr:hypothetical protein JRO89_XS01G0105000 [Xanthoceras sorbifolium]
MSIEMNVKTFTLEFYQKKSWGLFSDVTGEIVDSHDINPIVREVAYECGGLPRALVTVAGALKNKKTKYAWSDAKQQLRKSTLTNIKGMDRNVFASLKLSYNFLKNKELQSNFLLCCLFLEDYIIIR